MKTKINKIINEFIKFSKVLLIVIIILYFGNYLIIFNNIVFILTEDTSIQELMLFKIKIYPRNSEFFFLNLFYDIFPIIQVTIIWIIFNIIPCFLFVRDQDRTIITIIWFELLFILLIWFSELDFLTFLQMFFLLELILLLNTLVRGSKRRLLKLDLNQHFAKIKEFSKYFTLYLIIVGLILSIIEQNPYFIFNVIFIGLGFWIIIIPYKYHISKILLLKMI